MYSLAAFIKGMLFHDIAKPFFLQTRRHSRAGFMMLDAVGYHEEALAALCHHSTTMEHVTACLHLLALWKGTSSQEPLLPFWSLLASPIDQLASSAYGLTADYTSTNSWSRQNPFSRLPVCSDGYGACGNDSSRMKLHDVLWHRNGFDKIETCKKVGELLKDLITKDESKQGALKERVQELKTKFSSPDARGIIGEYCGAILKLYRSQIGQQAGANPYKVFRERTYPAANDTPLIEHGRFTAALALVVGANYQKTHPGGLFREVSHSTAPSLVSIDKVGQEQLVKDHHSAVLVRTSFKGFERLFQSAIRVDDLHGVRRLLDNPQANGEKSYRTCFQEAFVQRIADELDDPAVKEVICPINNLAFDQVYLLPGYLNEDWVRNAVEQAAQSTVSWAADHLAERFHEDFNHVKDEWDNKVDVPSPSADHLRKELNSLMPECFVRSVQVDPSLEFHRFKSDFGFLLSGSYQMLWRDDTISINQSHKETKFHEEWPFNEEPGIGDDWEVCEVCRLHPCFGLFYRFYEEQSEFVRTQLEKVIFDQKEEHERLCSLCLSMRVLSHGTTPNEWLRNMVFLDKENKMVRRREIQPVPDFPPFLLAAVQVDVENREPVDMGACFVRVSPDGDSLQVFPTVYCAADENSNIALLQMEPHGNILGTFDYLNTVQSLRFVRDENLKEVIGQLGSRTDEVFREGCEGAKKLYTRYNLDRIAPVPSTQGKSGNLPVQLVQLYELQKSAICDDFRCMKSDKPGNPCIENDFCFFQRYLTIAVCELERQLRSDIKDDDKTRTQQRVETFRRQVLKIRPHLARILTRIQWVDDFYRTLSDRLINRSKIRVLILEQAYPKLLLLAPAADLADMLREVVETMASELFSSMLLTSCNEAARESSLWLLQQILPSVLLSAVVVFKVRQPLYQVLNAARDLIQTLTGSPKPGLTLGFADMRSGLGLSMDPHQTMKSSLSFTDLYELLNCFERTERRSIMDLTSTVGDGQRLERLDSVLRFLVGVKKGWDQKVTTGLKRDEILQGTGFMHTVSRGRALVRSLSPEMEG